MSTIKERAERLLRIQGEKFYDSNLLRKELKKEKITVGSFLCKKTDCKYFLTESLAEQIIARDDVNFFYELLLRRDFSQNCDEKELEKLNGLADCFEDCIETINLVFSRRKDTESFNKNLKLFCGILIEKISYDISYQDFSKENCTSIQPLSEKELLFIENFYKENQNLLKSCDYENVKN